jgi:hypothetical protein
MPNWSKRVADKAARLAHRAAFLGTLSALEPHIARLEEAIALQRARDSDVHRDLVRLRLCAALDELHWCAEEGSYPKPLFSSGGIPGLVWCGVLPADHGDTLEKLSLARRPSLVRVVLLDEEVAVAHAWAAVAGMRAFVRALTDYWIRDQACAEESLRQLTERYPRAFSKDSRGSSPIPVTGPGWLQLLERLCQRITRALESDSAARFRIDDVIGKNGALRVFCQVADARPETEAEIDAAVKDAEREARCSCEICGAPAQPHEVGDTFEIACEAHRRGTPTPMHSVRGKDGA